MQKLLRGSGHLVNRHALDELLPTSAILVRLASPRDLADLVVIASREIPGVRSSEAGLAQFLRDNPESVFVFQRLGKFLGGIALLYLNCRGHDALLLNEIDLRNPDREFLARGHQVVSAIYVWALAGHGRAAAGLGNVAQYLRGPRFVSADYFAKPTTGAGRNLLIALGFQPVPSLQRELWRYQRPWNRCSFDARAVTSERCLEDARY